MCNLPQGSGSSCQSVPQLWRLPLSTKDNSFPGRYSFYSQSLSLMGVKKNKWKDHWLLPALTFKIWQLRACSGALLSGLLSFSHSALNVWWMEHKEDERVVNTCNPLGCQNDILANPIMINIGCIQRKVKIHRNSHFSSQKCLLSLIISRGEGDIANRWRNLGARQLVSGNSLIHSIMHFVHKCSWVLLCPSPGWAPMGHPASGVHSEVRHWMTRDNSNATGKEL